MFLLRGLSWTRHKISVNVLTFTLQILATGPIPKHVAFVMDGNRRYAQTNHKAIQQGHFDGFIALLQMLEVCMRLNVKCISAYAFSIENFKRSEEEVSALMTLMDKGISQICKPGGFMDKYNVRLNVIGDTKLLPDFLRDTIREAEDKTRYNKCGIFNLCIPYTSRHEITTAVESCVRNSVSQQLQDPIITEDDIDSQLMTSLGDSPPLDILIRTSGAKRLSDFMLWHCCEDTQLHFPSTVWPDFGLFDFIPIILDYQRKIWNRQSSL